MASDDDNDDRNQGGYDKTNTDNPTTTPTGSKKETGDGHNNKSKSNSSRSSIRRSLSSFSTSAAGASLRQIFQWDLSPEDDSDDDDTPSLKKTSSTNSTRKTASSSATMRHVGGFFRHGTTSTTSSIFFYSAVGLSLAMAIALKPFGSIMTVLWTAIISTDLGNAIAALVAVGGYMLEHINQRKAQQMEAQIQRVSDQSHKFLVPVTLQFHSIMWTGILHFVDKNLERIFDDIDNDELTRRYVPDTVKDELVNHGIFTPPTHLNHPVSFVLMISDVLMAPRVDATIDKDRSVTSLLGLAPSMVQPRELPQVVHDAVYKCRPIKTNNDVSSLWKDYERFVRNELVPGIERIAEIIDEYGDLMEPVPSSRLEEIYGRPDNGYGQKWSRMPRMWFYSLWLGYARSWKTVLQAWDEDDYTQIRPLVDFPTGIMFFNIEGQTIVGKVEKELIGMSQMSGSGQ